MVTRSLVAVATPETTTFLSPTLAGAFLTCAATVKRLRDSALWN